MKYMVMECHPAYAVVMSEDGRFLKTANRHYQVGQTVTDIIEMQLPQEEKKGSVYPWKKWIVSVAACMALAVTVVLYQSQVAYASVYLEINPKVRIGVNRMDRVVSLEAANAEGESLLHGYQYWQKNVDQVVTELVDRAIAQEYLQPGGQVSVKLDANNADWTAVHNQEIRDALNHYLNGRWEILVNVDDWDDLLDEEDWYETDAEDDREDADDFEEDWREVLEDVDDRDEMDEEEETEDEWEESLEDSEERDQDESDEEDDLEDEEPEDEESDADDDDA